MGQIIEAALYDSIARKKAMDALLNRYPFIRKQVIGRSCGGRDMIAYQIGTGKESCLFTAAFHGSEHITAVVLMMFLEDFAEAIFKKETLAGYPLNRALENRSQIFIPCINPDGCDIAVCGKAACGDKAKEIGKLCKNDFSHWNANLRGVDLNHNFAAGWKELRKKESDAGIYGPSPTRYGGPYPESEPETKALSGLCKIRRIRHAVALHAQGEVIYYRYGRHTSVRAERMAQLLAAASGYTIEEPVGLAVGGGFKDWFTDTFHRPGFTVELGKGTNPLPPENAREIYEKVKEMLTICAIL